MLISGSLQVFLFQKAAVHKCNMAGKPAVVTRVVDSMTDNLRPTRAEATDVANAVLDGNLLRHFLLWWIDVLLLHLISHDNIGFTILILNWDNSQLSTGFWFVHHLPLGFLDYQKSKRKLVEKTWFPYESLTFNTFRNWCYSSWCWDSAWIIPSRDYFYCWQDLCRGNFFWSLVSLGNCLHTIF